MGLPELTFTLKKAAETVSTRISRGAVALILRDSKANGVHVVCQESDTAVFSQAFCSAQA